MARLLRPRHRAGRAGGGLDGDRRRGFASGPVVVAGGHRRAPRRADLVLAQEHRPLHPGAGRRLRVAWAAAAARRPPSRADLALVRGAKHPVFQPWDWDNTKFFSYWALFG